jgi:hypothetical protein
MEGYFPGLLYLTKALYGFEPRNNSKDKIEEEDDSKGILEEGDSVHHKFKSPMLVVVVVVLSLKII